jgi:hypothetical protein
MKNLKINLNNMKLLSGKKLKLCSLMLAGLLTACSQEADCDINEYHAHKYYNADGYVKYLNKEYLNYDGYTRDEEFIYLNEEDKYLNDFIENKNLISLSDNIKTEFYHVINAKDGSILDYEDGPAEEDTYDKNENDQSTEEDNKSKVKIK